MKRLSLKNKFDWRRWMSMAGCMTLCLLLVTVDAHAQDPVSFVTQGYAYVHNTLRIPFCLFISTVAVALAIAGRAGRGILVVVALIDVCWGFVPWFITTWAS
ncbi:MAG: hypothetical protein M3458_19185 [Acidobacteriota bacterium]|nr:hypothetical protein [Acidobacteriota bacterium]